MSSLDMRRQNRATSNAKAKLSKYSAELDNDDFGLAPLLPSSLPPALLQAIPSGTGGGSMASLAAKPAPRIDREWKTTLVGCGSNSFSQLSFDTFELNSSSLKLVNIKNTANKTLSQLDILSISCNSNLTSAIVNESNSKGSAPPALYFWGDGLLPSTIRVPTIVQLPREMSLAVSIAKVSCGQSHAGLVSSDGKVFTWGSGEYGMTGLGTKSHVSSPKLVAALKDVFAVDISCGAFHTAIIADEASKIRKLEIPLSSSITASLLEDQPSPTNSSTATYQRLRDAGEEPCYLTCGSLYMCGLGKAGQLGLGRAGTGVSAAASNQSSPILIKDLQERNLMVAKVSCGFHHTLAVAVPWDVAMNGRAFETKVLAFGWGEHGRLGLGDEDSRFEPTEVKFPSSFHATDVCAGEQHSIAWSISEHRPQSKSQTRDGSGMPHYDCYLSNCYSWGNNSMGQLGVGSPAIAETVLAPMQVPVPEGMYLKSVAAGGRHSAAITYCGRLLSWGWGEEGQLGHGTEKSSYLPRPVRIPKVGGVVGKPIMISLGMTHTLAVLSNPQFKTPTPQPIIAQTPPKPPALSPPLSPKVETPVIIENAEIENVAKPAVICNEDDMQRHEIVAVAENVVESGDGAKEEPEEEEQEEEMILPVRSIKELLQLRDDRLATPPVAIVKEDLSDEIKADSNDEVKEDVQENPKEEESELPGEEVEEIVVEPPVKADPDEEVTPALPQLPNITDTVVTTAAAEEVKNSAPKVGIYYKDGQDLDSCLVANSAKRAVARKLKKEQSKK